MFFYSGNELHSLKAITPSWRFPILGLGNRRGDTEEAIIIIIDDAMQVDGNPLPCYVTYVLFFCDANGYLTARPVSCACVCIHMHDTI